MRAPSLMYRLLSPLLFLFWLIHAVIHAYQFKSLQYLYQRLGFIPKPTKNSLWIHASSVGEVNLIQPLCEQLLEKGYSITLSTFTASGLQRAQTLFKQRVCITTLPIDCWPISTLFCARLKPQCAIIAETELWPETLYQMAKANVPLVHINARLSKKSLDAHPAIKNLLQTTLSYFDLHLCRYNSDIAHFKAMGVIESKIKVLGNLKYAAIQQVIEPQANLVGQAYILCASTHDDEECQLYSSITSDNNQLLIVIAPRHPKRSDSIVKALCDHLLSRHQIAVRSKNQTINEHTKVYLADTFGEITALMQHAELVIMGGSFVDVGGHNILEPAALAKCIITGPSDSNINNDVEELVKHHAIMQVHNINELNNEVIKLLNDPKLRQQLGENAQKYCLGFESILESYIENIESACN